MHATQEWEGALAVHARERPEVEQDQAVANIFNNFNNGDFAAYSSGLIKPLPTGGTASITFDVNYSKLGAVPQGFAVINPSYTPSVTFAFEQPLLLNDFSRAAHLFFIAQEAAINAAKHAAAGRIDVRLTGTRERFTLSVSDDGSGVNDEVLRRYRGTGLGLMEERAEILGVPLEVRSQPGRGTTVSVSLTG